MKTTSRLAAALVFLAAAQLSAAPAGDTGSGPVSESTKTVSGLSPFCKAVMQGDTAMVQKMITLGADVNEKSLGKTPLIYAARYNKTEVLKVLLANGADPGIRCDRGYTAMKHAELSGADEALRILQQAS